MKKKELLKTHKEHLERLYYLAKGDELHNVDRPKWWIGGAMEAIELAHQQGYALGVKETVEKIEKSINKLDGQYNNWKNQKMFYKQEVLDSITNQSDKE